MSEHEGFCIPIIESMAMGVPVLAFHAAAVPETMDGAGVLFTDKRFDQIGEMIARLARDETYRNGIIEGQNQRIERYRNQNVEEKLKTYLQPLL
ncbi:MAG: glycosyltransferase, partial [Verrucomicrobiota bacterium]